MAEKEYIERGALIEKAMKSRENSPYTDTNADLIHRIEHNKFISMAANQPAADVVEVVRCKDCIYNEIGSCKLSEDYDPGYDPNFYCANGERREQ